MASLGCIGEFNSVGSQDNQGNGIARQDVSLATNSIKRPSDEVSDTVSPKAV